MTTGRHFVQICVHGYVHAQCRCPSKDKHVIKTGCTDPEHAASPKTEASGKN